MQDPSNKSNRRAFLRQGRVIAAAPLLGGLGPILHAKAAPAALPSNNERPLLAQGIQIGDVSFDRALVWSRSDRPARLLVEWDLDPRFRRPRLVRGPHALEDSDYIDAWTQSLRVALVDLNDNTVFQKTLAAR